MSKPWKRRMFLDPLTDAIFAYCVDVAAPNKFLQGTSNFCGNLADYLREHGFAAPVECTCGKPSAHASGWCGVSGHFERVAAQQAAALGTFACPVCGRDTPHRHDGEA